MLRESSSKNEEVEPHGPPHPDAEEQEKTTTPAPGVSAGSTTGVQHVHHTTVIQGGVGAYAAHGGSVAGSTDMNIVTEKLGAQGMAKVSDTYNEPDDDGLYIGSHVGAYASGGIVKGATKMSVTGEPSNQEKDPARLRKREVIDGAIGQVARKGGEVHGDVDVTVDYTAQSPMEDTSMTQGELGKRDCYPMNLKQRGSALIVMLETFDPSTKLESISIAGKEAAAFKQLTEGLGFNAIVMSESDRLETEDIKHEIKRTWNGRKAAKHQAAILIILSHGNNDDHGEYIYGYDGVKLYYQEIVELMNEQKNLRGKPKIVFIIACRGGKTEWTLAPSLTEEFLKNHCRDFFFVFASKEEYMAWYNRDGSYLQQELSAVLSRPGTQHLEELIQQVQKNLDSKKITKDKGKPTETLFRVRCEYHNCFQQVGTGGERKKLYFVNKT